MNIDKLERGNILAKSLMQKEEVILSVKTVEAHAPIVQWIE